MGVAGSAKEESTDPGLEVIRLPKLFRVLPDDVCARLYALRDDGSTTTASSIVDGLYRRALRLRYVQRRLGLDHLHAHCGYPDLESRRTISHHVRVQQYRACSVPHDE